jgi:hypothetical protein
MADERLKVISASRRTDMVAWFPDLLCDRIAALTPEKIHTLVIWTKNPVNMLRHERLRRTLESLDQVFVHLTVTGMGGSEMEPGVPDAGQILPLLAQLVEMSGDPNRIRWRFDPIVIWDSEEGRKSNEDAFHILAPSFANAGILNVITSIYTVYPKVITRFRNLSRFTPVIPDPVERRELIEKMELAAARSGMTLSWCCENGKCPAKCIDGDLLSRLHPKRLDASTERAVDQRDSCGCTRSLDIGWYNQVCRGGCLYCYANPVTSRRTSTD